MLLKSTPSYRSCSRRAGSRETKTTSQVKPCRREYFSFSGEECDGLFSEVGTLVISLLSQGASFIVSSCGYLLLPLYMIWPASEDTIDPVSMITLFLGSFVSCRPQYPKILPACDLSSGL